MPIPKTTTQPDVKPSAAAARAGAMPSRDRLEELVALAQGYRAMPRRDVAARLGRDVHNLIPETGNPKLDFVVKLAALLDWPVEMVVAELYAGDRAVGPEDLSAENARQANRLAWEQVVAEQWDAARRTAAEVLAGSAPLPAKGYAAQMLFVSLESQGMYLEAMDAARRGLELLPVRSDAAFLLRAYLAHCHYITGSLYEADGLASSLIAALSEIDRGSPLRQALAAAHAVRGHSLRVMATSDMTVGADASERPGIDLAVARRAVGELERAAEIYDDYAARGTSARDAALADTARGGLLELRVLLNETSYDDAIAQILDRLEGTEKLDALDSSVAEALAWWCIFGANVVLRHEPDTARAQHLLAILTNKADEVASRLGHWALRERVFTLEHLSQVRGAADLEDRGPSFDTDDLRVLTGTMARFPAFRRTGWKIMRSRVQPDDGGEL